MSFSHGSRPWSMEEMTVKETMNNSVKAAPKEKPVISFVCFKAEDTFNPESSNAISCGGAWDKGWKNGALSIKLDLTEVPNAYVQDSLRLKGFVKSSYQDTVLTELVKSIESRYITRLKGEDNPVVPIFDIVLKRTLENNETESIRVGCIWRGSLQNLILNVYLEPQLIPEAMRGAAMYGAVFTKKHDLEIPKIAGASV